MDWSHAPADVMIKIASELGDHRTSGVASMRLVCKGWWQSLYGAPACLQPNAPDCIDLDVFQHAAGLDFAARGSAVLLRPAALRGICERLPRLTALDVSGAWLGDAVTTVTNCRELTALRADACGLTDVGLASFGVLDMLQVLSLRRCRLLQGSGFAALGTCSRLQSLNLRDSGVNLGPGPSAVPEAIACLTSLFSLDLSGCKALTNEGLTRLASLSLLRFLYIRGSEGITDAGVVGLCAGACRHTLETLDVSDCSRLEAASLCAIAVLPRLRCLGLELQPAAMLVPSALSALSSCVTLRRLDLTEARMSVSGMFDLGHAIGATLQELDLGGIRFVREWSLAAGAFHALESVSLSGCVGFELEAAMAFMEANPQLRRLNLDRCRLSDATKQSTQPVTPRSGTTTPRCAGVHRSSRPSLLSRQRSLPSAQTVLSRAGSEAASGGLRRTTTSATASAATALPVRHKSSLSRGTSQLFGQAQGMDPLATAFAYRLSLVPGLRQLSLARCRGVSDAHLDTLCTLSELEDLNLRGCRHVTGQVVDAISSLSKLSSLDMSACRVSDQDCAKLASLVNLRVLRIGGWPGFTGSGLKTLPALSSVLHTLDLQRSRNLGNDALESVRHLTQLRTLRLSNCPRLTAAGLQTLTGLTSVSELDLHRCASAVTDESFTSLASSLRGSLAKLNIAESQELTPVGCSAVSQLSSLVSLDLTACQQLQDDPEFLARLASWTRAEVALAKGGTSPRQVLIEP